MKQFLTTVVLAVMISSIPGAKASSMTFALNSSDASLTTSNGVVTLSLGSLGSIVFTGYSCPYVSCSVTPNSPQYVLPYGLSYVNGALGLSDGSGGESEILPYEFVIVDFSNLKVPLSSVTLNMTDVVDGWDIYATQPNQLASSPGPSPTAQGNNATHFSTSQYPNIDSSINQGATSGSSTFALPAEYISVTALQAECDGCPKVEIASITLTDVVVPEPMTVMTTIAGGLLLSIGLVGKRRRKHFRSAE